MIFQIRTQQQMEAYERMFSKARLQLKHLQQLSEIQKKDETTDYEHEPASNRIYNCIIAKREFDDYGRRIKINTLLDKSSCDIVKNFKEKKFHNTRIKNNATISMSLNMNG